MPCEPIYCQSFDANREIMIAQDPTGSGGIALNDNFTELQYRQPKCKYDNGGDPMPANDSTEEFCVGSRWLNTSTGKMWICINNTATAAVWVPWLRWLDQTQWYINGAQNQLLLVDTHFGVTGEIRQLLDTTNAVVLVPYDAASAGGAVQIQTADGTPAAGNIRGASAVDFQNSRVNAAQVASGITSFIAGGNSNTASGEGAHAHGQLSQATGSFSHAEGSADETSTKVASGEGSHAQGMAENSGAIGSTANGAHSFGNANGGEILAAADGAHAGGIAESGGYIQVVSGANGGHAGGAASNSGVLGVSAEGGHAYGSADGGQILAASNGAHASGSAFEIGDVRALRNHKVALSCA